MLLALGCGVAIMLAGAVFLFQLTNQADLAEPVPIGQPTIVGDMTVTVDSSDEADGLLDVSVTIGGVSDIDGGEAFRLIASGRPVTALPDGPAVCAATTTEAITCHVYFDVAASDGTSRVLFYERGDDQARWVLG